MTPSEQLLDLLLIASNARTPEEKARVAWRANDHMWRSFPVDLCRAFNNLLQDQNYPWVHDLWPPEEAVEGASK